MPTIAVRAPAGTLTVEIFEPAAAGARPLPGVVLLHDLLGLGDEIRRVARLIADRGYLVAAPDLYSRRSRVRCVVRQVGEVMRARGETFDDIDATRRALADLPGCGGSIGVVGFCQGGRFALLVAGTGDYDAAAPFYGTPLPPKIEQRLTGVCPVVASFGGKDPWNPRGTAGPQVRDILERLDVEHDVAVYPEAGHAFANRYPAQPVLRVARFGYDDAAAADAWDRVFAFFAAHLRR
ncbi:dienelactone hydrolase family protein [Mycolicibacterium brumae]|uniref:dienelactone hydrolase family protein n=1 Tax=Mycolicibacterium brumae TaxID=85968 RepID=UPI0013A59D18|nr:dienelactone hydrolase family protein [Mycolicibacterium brumae]MCV7194564.1 dienelactone hydrolase family protein [Mycolicibacterium brumae]UWW08904.1 dienelactone hydrolase family protein [Mycolicibacterium brumae]